MLLQYFYDDRLAQASYLVGCPASGEALVVDPARDVTPYLRAASRKGLRITSIAETHIHADFVSGARELAAYTGASIFLSGSGGDRWRYAYADAPGVVTVRDGNSWQVGAVRIEVLATPGHTPEHIALLVTDTATADAPIGLFSGDCLFVGDVGRPDLLETAAGHAGTKEAGARAQFASLGRLRGLPPYLQVWPGHGAGSACGKALGAIPSTTLGYETRFNPAFQHTREGDFVAWLLSNQPEPPRYFARMKQINQAGPRLLGALRAPQRIGRDALAAARDAGRLVVDLRPADDYARGHMPGTLSIPATSDQWSTYVGWYVDYAEPCFFVAPDDGGLGELLAALRAIGVDDVGGYAVASAVATEGATLPRVDVVALAAHLQRKDAAVLDVRGRSEYADIHLPGAINIPIGLLPQHLDAVPRDRPLVVQCASGYRAQIATSLLRRYGFDNAVALHDPEGRWKEEARKGERREARGERSP